MLSFIKIRTDSSIYVSVGIYYQEDLKAVIKEEINTYSITTSDKSEKNEELTSSMVELLHQVSSSIQSKRLIENKIEQSNRHKLKTLFSQSEQDHDRDSNHEHRYVNDPKPRIKILPKNVTTLENSKNLKLSFDFSNNQKYDSNRTNEISTSQKRDSQREAQNQLSPKEQNREHVNITSTNKASKYYLKGILSYAPRTGLNMVKVNDISSKFKHLNSKTQSNSKSKSKESHSNSRVNSTSMSKSKSKPRLTIQNPILTNPVAVKTETINLNKIIVNNPANNNAGINNMIYNPNVNNIPTSTKSQSKNIFMKINKNTTSKKTETINDFTKLNKAQPLHNNYQKNSADKRHTKPSEISVNIANINSTLNQDSTTKHKTVTLSPKNSLKRNTTDLKDNRILSTINNSISISLNESNKNMKRHSKKILDLTYNANSDYRRQTGKLENTKTNSDANPKDRIEIIQNNNSDENMINDNLDNFGNEQQQNNQLLKEVQNNLDDNMKNYFNFSYDNFLNKDDSDSDYSKKSELSETEIVTPGDYKTEDIYRGWKKKQLQYPNKISFDENEDKLKDVLFKK